MEVEIKSKNLSEIINGLIKIISREYYASYREQSAGYRSGNVLYEWNFIQLESAKWPYSQLFKGV